jgi:hypothetical protein
MSDKYTLTITNLTKAEAIEVVENKFGSLMFDRVNNITTAYPARDIEVQIKKTKP